MIHRDAGNVLVLTVDLDQGDLPLRTTFPIMVTNAISWFAGSKGELRESLASGAITQIELPRAAAKLPSGSEPTKKTEAIVRVEKSKGQTVEQNIVLRDPHGKTYQLPNSSDVATIGPLDQTGIWSLVQTGEKGEAADVKPLREIACNLHNPRESDLRLTHQSEESTQPLTAGFGGRPVWFYGLVCVVVVWRGVVSVPATVDELT